jgi:hypothetical protein
MIEIIIKEFQKIAYAACEKHAASLGLPAKEAQLVLGLNSEGEVTYCLCRNYNPEKKVSFLQVLGVKIDFKGYSMIVPPFIQSKLIALAEERQVAPEKISVMIIPTDDKRTIMWIYVDSTPKEQIKIEDLFG